ncbi:MAG TPA: copper chaperone PCu(A)C [Allosphingosinicella sp.]|nr:copper chaperone PCu(A)C [Allosphingosinicella sp.]
MRLPLLLLAALAALAGCDSGTRSVTTVSNGWIRLPAVAGQPAAGYFTIEATDDHGALIRVTSSRAGRIEMHKTSMSGSMAGMEKVERISLKGGREIAFAPGGRHLMLFDLDPALRAGGTADLIFHFEHGAPATFEASVVGPGDESPVRE